MNATTVGKSLVFVNLVLSMIFATWAIGIYTNRIDWPGGGTPSVPGERALGEVGKRKAEITEAEKAAGLALANWQSWTGTLTQLEQVQRPQARAWFAAKLKGLEEGAGPVPSLVYGMDGKLQVGAEGQPIASLKPRAALRQEIAAVDAETERVAAQANKDLKAAEELTIQINGIREGNLVKQKGLRDLLAEEEQAGENARNEIEYVRPLRYNRQAEVELLQKRQASLARRMAELKQEATASRGP
jgi:hypothetical protein